MADGLKVRLRLATPTAMIDGRVVDVELPPSMIPLNDHLIAELVEDHPTYISTAKLDEDISDEALAAALDAAIDNTLEGIEFRTAILKRPLDDGTKAEFHVVMGPSPWTTALGLALASGWCPRSELAGKPLRIAIPARSLVFYIEESAVQADPRLGKALDDVARETYAKTEDREKLFAGTFVAGNGRLEPTASVPAAMLEADSVTPAAIDPLHVTMRRLLAALVEALAKPEPDIAGGLVQLASESLDPDGDFGGERFVPAIAIVLQRSASSLPDWMRPSALALASALDSDAAATPDAAVHDVLAAIDQHTNRALAAIESQLRGLDPWFAGAPVLAADALVAIDDDDLPAFVHRVGWMALAELRPHLGADVQQDFTTLATRTVFDGTDAWIEVTATALALLEPHLDCHPAVRLAYARLSASMTLVHRGLHFGVEPTPARHLIAELITVWQWVRGVVATSPPTTPSSWPTDAAADAERLLAQWRARGGPQWLDRWLKTTERLGHQLDLLKRAHDATLEAQNEHLDAAATVVAALRKDGPPEATDGAAALQHTIDELAAARPGVNLQARGSARFLDCETADELLGPDMALLVELFESAVWLTCGQTPSAAQARLAADFLGARSTPTLAAIHDRYKADPALADRLLGKWSRLPEDPTPAMLRALVMGASELKRCADADTTRKGILTLLGDVCGQAKSWWGLRSAPGRKDRNRLENVRRLLELTDRHTSFRTP